MSARFAAALLVAAAAAVALALAGCQGVALRRDQRVFFVSPPDRARVAAPLEVRWRVRRHEFHAGGFDGSRSSRRGVYAVFVDRPPLRPGQHLDALAGSDRICKVTPGCPDSAYLAGHGVFLTTHPHLSLPAFPADGGRLAGSLRRHEVTVVLLDGRGVRSGEGAWTLTLYAPDGRVR